MKGLSLFLKNKFKSPNIGTPFGLECGYNDKNIGGYAMRSIIAVLALLFFPFGVIFELAKKYK